jgi:uncharacterized protein YdhG (YjbR/CyaY superfamily)
MTYQQSPLVDEYIAGFPEPIRERLTWVRKAIQATFPKTIEDISYGMPTYRPAPGKRGIVHFAAAKDHIGLYAIFEPKNDANMHRMMTPYRTGKGTLQFKNSEKLPKTVIRDILLYHSGHFPKEIFTDK